jgi:CPA2 family monovalent cation:H+ antiporter-2
MFGGALAISLPFLIATYRKLNALSLLLAEIIIGDGGKFVHGLRRVVAEVIPVLSIAGILLLIGLLSASILPPTNMLIMLLVAAAIMTGLLWKTFVRWHSGLQIALFETLEEHADEKA